MLRIGEINYLNCTPLFTALRNTCPASVYQFISGHPSELNKKLRVGDIDLCPSSSIEYALHPELYRIVPDLSISSRGPVKSVLLFSRLPIDALDGASIGLTSESETSVILLKILLTLKFSFANSYARADVDLNRPYQHDALLLIGDKALLAATEKRSGYLYDLGELWYEFTGKPFVFALWLLRDDALLKSAEAVYLLQERLVSAKNTAIGSLTEIASTLKQTIWTSDFLINYWHVISYDLTQDHIDGLKLFYHYAAECGFIEAEPQLRML